MATCSGGRKRFPYQPLAASRTIRLLKFLPGSTPKCQMIAVEVEKAPPYVALSYTWGSKHLERSIEVNGLDMPITRSLAEAIDAIYDFARRYDLMFWADSACINQDDVHERGRQVRFMGTIYRSAELVTVWLGPAADDSDFAFDNFIEWKKALDELTVQYGGSAEMAVANIAAEDPVFFGPPGSEQHRALCAIYAIYRRPWWRRAWIVQEGTAAAPHRTFLFCGKRNVDWTCFQAALCVTLYVSHDKTTGISDDFEHGMPGRLGEFRSEREVGGMIKLLKVLRQIRAYECEDPRDKVYASLGMVMDGSEDYIVPDYTKPYQAVYMDVVRQCLSSRSMHSLDFLGYVARPDPGSSVEFQSDSSLPTWVPDWNLRVSLWALAKDSAPDDFSSDILYNACGSRLGEQRIENKRLYLYGSVLRSISQVYSLCDTSRAPCLLTIVRSWMSAMPDLMYVTGETLREAFDRTLLADARQFYERAEVTRGASVNWDLLDQKASDMTPAERLEQDWMITTINMTTFMRRLIRTSDGLIGIGPAACRPNDKICLFFGGQVLYILREHGHSEWEFMGECYVHGMMDGQGLEDKSFAPRDFVIV